MSTSAPVNFPKLSRRQSLQLGAATTATGLLAASKLVTPVEAKDVRPEVRPPTTTPFVVDLLVYTAKTPVGWVPGSLSPAPTQNANWSGGECGRPSHQRASDWPSQKYYEMRVKEAMHSFHPDLPTQKIWGYDGILPGPTFVERYGVPITVRIINELPANSVGYGSPEISTHLHNLHCGSESDGFTGDYYSATKHGPTMTGPGAYKDHHYPNCYAGYDDPKYHATEGDPREALGAMATFSRCQLDHAALAGARLESTVFCESSLIDVNADDSEWKHACVLKCDLAQLTWARARLTRTMFTGTALREKSFVGLVLDGCQFSFADLTGADFSGVSIRQCNFQGATLNQACFRQAVGPNALFCEAQGAQVDFSQAQLRQALFTGGQFPGARFDGADLYQCHFAGANLAGASLAGAQLTYADFRHGDLRRADLRQATLSRTVLHGTKTEEAQMSDRTRAIETDPELDRAERWTANA